MATESEINNLYDFIIPLAERAGSILREGYTSQKEITIKGAYDMVTNYDHQIEDFLIKEISAVYPNHKFIGEEESAARNVMTVLTDDPTWIIDPIDGTSNFIKQLGHTCVSIGLSINKDIVLGVVINPILNETYTAKKNQGAYLNGRKIKVSDCEKIADAMIGYEISLLHLADIRAKHIKRIYALGSKSTRMLSYSSVVLALCYVARGSLDGYHIEDMFPWDVAAGMLIIGEAGGFILNPLGGEVDIMKPSLVCAGRESLCQEIVSLIQEADQMKEIKLD